MNKTLVLVFISLMVPVIACAQVRTVDLLIINGTVITMDMNRSIVEKGALAVNEGIIIAVGNTKDLLLQYKGKHVIDAGGNMIIPGLINGHNHIPMTLFRGIADDLDLDEWLTKYIFPAEKKNVTADFVRAGTRLGLAEMIKGGTTTYCDMYYFEEEIAQETSKAGMRAVLGETMIDFPAPDNKTFDEATAYIRQFAAKWKNHPLIIPAIAPHAPYTVSEAHLKQIRTLSDQMELPVIIHLSETQKEVADITKEKGMPPVEYLQHIGFLNNRVIAAHLVFATDKEIDMLKMQGTGAVHNPQSNMKLASGISPVPAMLKKQVPVGLGTDGAASNNDLSLWEEMDIAAKLHKVNTLDPKVVSAEEAFAMATIGGARALHLDKKIGSLENGKLADIVIINTQNLHQVPAYNAYSNLVYATKASDVITVIINGKIIMKDRKLLTLNEDEIKKTAELYRDKIIKSLEK